MNGHTPDALVDHPIFSKEGRRPNAATGAFHYPAARRSRRILWGSMIFSAALHGIVLLGFNRHTAVKNYVAVEDAVTVALVMPDLKDLEEPEPEQWEGEPPVDAGLTVPTLADVPTQVDLSTAFVQQIDYSTLVPQQDLSAAKTLSIPTHIARSGKIGEGMGKIFELKDLDRVPEPLVRIAPVVPATIREAGMHIEVSVGFIVDTEGVVRGAYIMQSTDRRIDDAAVIAIGKWKFRPGYKSGKKVNVRMVQPLVVDVTDAS